MPHQYTDVTKSNLHFIPVNYRVPWSRFVQYPAQVYWTTTRYPVYYGKPALREIARTTYHTEPPEVDTARVNQVHPYHPPIRVATQYPFDLCWITPTFPTCIHPHTARFSLPRVIYNYPRVLAEVIMSRYLITTGACVGVGIPATQLPKDLRVFARLRDHFCASCLATEEVSARDWALVIVQVQ